MSRLLLLLVFLSSATVADTVYIRDVIYVPLRGGQSSEYRILHQGIRSGTPLERLETNEETGYTRVRRANGMEGWIQTQYLVEEPIAREVLERVQEQLESLKATHESALSELAEQRDSETGTQSEVSELISKNTELTAELSRITQLSTNVIEINQLNEQLQLERDNLNQQIDDLVEGNANLRDETTQTWFLLGAGTIMLGLLFGFWIGRQLTQNRNSNWN